MKLKDKKIDILYADYEPDECGNNILKLKPVALSVWGVFSATFPKEVYTSLEMSNTGGSPFPNLPIARILRLPMKRGARKRRFLTCLFPEVKHLPE